MSRSILQCRACHKPLGEHRRDGTLHIAAEVRAIFKPRHHRLILICPCGHEQTYYGEGDRKTA